MYFDDEEDSFEDALDAFEARISRAEDPTEGGHEWNRAIRMVGRTRSNFAQELRDHLDQQRREAVPVVDADTALVDSQRRKQWYSGPRSHRGVWPSYRSVIEENLPEAAVGTIDETTTKILGLAANPLTPGDKAKGLVIGHVQSGKTANYAGLIAKAVDEGYRIVIVLAGMHSNLRQQTQARLDNDLGFNRADIKNFAWLPGTDKERDVGAISGVAGLGSRENCLVFVVKKNKRRLENLRDFLHSLNESHSNLLRRRAVLIIDDEADQASPNSTGERDVLSTIHRLLQEIWGFIPTGSYIAYTATPFANLLMNPADPQGLYPDDFAFSLPKPDGYLGSDEFFNTTQTADAEDDLAAHLSTEVPDHEAAELTVTGKNIDAYDPEIPDTLQRAIIWFVLSTAIRRLRSGDDTHASMLVHTSHRVRAHFRLKDAVKEYVVGLANDLPSEEGEFRSVFDEESPRSEIIRQILGRHEAMPTWQDVWHKTESVLSDLSVKVDNGLSDDRLDYTGEGPETVIAIGGGTLSRGLTLEGLCVSYFLRSSNLYDTLLQMGRWFGFRPGYADLVRVWVAPGLLDEFAHLARVERELREDIDEMSRASRTPKELAAKILLHPGRLAITSKGKMSEGVVVQAGLGGTRRQTIYLDRSPEGSARSQEAARDLLARSLAAGGRILHGTAAVRSGTTLITGVEHHNLIDFLHQYWVSPVERWLQASPMETWLKAHGTGKNWNILVVGGRGTEHSLGSGITVKTVSRAPFRSERWSRDEIARTAGPGADVVNIGALMSEQDLIGDLRILSANGELDNQNAELLKSALANSKGSSIRGWKGLREEILPDTGLIILYLVDKDSQPQKRSADIRESMTFKPHQDGEAMEGNHIIGLGLVYPPVPGESLDEYLAVELPELVDERAEGFEDTEGDAEVPEP
nr:Z1 domain-containing protein [Helcobacillus sp. ACRRO]